MRTSKRLNNCWSWWSIIVFAYLLTVSSGCDRTEPTDLISDKAHAPVIRFQDKLYDVSVVDERHVWVVGYFGTILHSEDGGKSWARKNPGTTDSLLGVSFVSVDEGWIVGELGTILHTRDGGESWERQASPVPQEKLLRVQFVNEREGWAVGTFGVILHTADGGKHWERLPFEEDVILNDLCFLNAEEGWVAGEFETILHTVNGGEIWETQHGELYGDQYGKLFGISFRDAGQGVAVGTQGKVLFTEDGGRSWHEGQSPTEDTVLKVQFHGRDHAVAVGLRGAVICTENGGRKWSVVSLPYHYSWLSGVAFTEAGDGFLVGDGGRIFMTSDSGRSWTAYNPFSG